LQRLLVSEPVRAGYEQQGPAQIGRSDHDLDLSLARLVAWRKGKLMGGLKISDPGA
jgi:hypothetical protein